MRVIEFSLEKFLMKFSQSGPFIAIAAWQLTKVSGSLHGALRCLGRNQIDHPCPNKFGTHDVRIEGEVMADKDIGRLHGIKKGVENRLQRNAVVDGKLRGNAMLLERTAGDREPFWSN